MHIELTNNISEKQAAYPQEFLLRLYERLVTCRQFEERVKLLFLEGSMPGTSHQSQGEEGSAGGVWAALNPDDIITTTHRPHVHAPSKSLTTDETMPDLFGKATCWCKGKR